MKNIILFLCVFILQGCSQKTYYDFTLKINGKVSPEQYTKIEEIVSTLPNNKKQKLTRILVDRTDIREDKEFKPSERLNYKESIFTSGEYHSIDSITLENNVKLMLDNNYKTYDDIIVWNEFIDYRNYIDRLLNKNFRKKSNVYKILTIVNVNEIKSTKSKIYHTPEIKQCPSLIILSKIENAMLCIKDNESGFLFKWEITPDIEDLNFLITIQDESRIIFSDTCRYEDCFLKNGTYGYFLSNAMFGEKIQNRYQKPYLENFKWKIICLNNSPKNSYGVISDYFNFGKCPDAKDPLRPCDE
jgi:hypothetical protein